MVFFLKTILFPIIIIAMARRQALIRMPVHFTFLPNILPMLGQYSTFDEPPVMAENDIDHSNLRESLAAKLQLARQALGLSTRRASEALLPNRRLSHTTIHKYERGITTPSLEVLEILAKLYNCPLEWFVQTGATLSNVRYHDFPGRDNGKSLQFELEVNRWIDAYGAIENHLDTPLQGNLGGLCSRPDETPRELAIRVRAKLKINSEPIPSVMRVLEQFGIRTIEQPTNLKIGGFTAKYGAEYVIAFTPNVGRERSRLNAACELGHILFGDGDGTENEISKMSQKRALDFASHLLLPDQQLQEALVGPSFERLSQFEQRFGISVSEMIERAESSGLLTPYQTNNLWIEFDKQLGKSRKPIETGHDRATRFEELIDQAINDGCLTLGHAATVACVRPQELRSRMELALD